MVAGRLEFHGDRGEPNKSVDQIKHFSRATSRRLTVVDVNKEQVVADWRFPCSSLLWPRDLPAGVVTRQLDHRQLIRPDDADCGFGDLIAAAIVTPAGRL